VSKREHGFVLESLMKACCVPVTAGVYLDAAAKLHRNISVMPAR
jgi:hypothetical protein